MTDTETSSEDIEEILVFAEFEDSVNINKYNSIHVLGIDTKNPIFQLDETFFTGTYKNPLGTYMFFEEDPSPHSSDPLFDKLPEKNLKYLCKTRKQIYVEHAYIAPKEGILEQENQNDVPECTSDDVKPVEFKSIQEALEKFEKEWSKKFNE